MGRNRSGSSTTMASMQSTTAASQASSMGIGSGSGNINSSDLALYDIPLVTSPSQASTDFEQLLHNLQSISVDPKSVRKAACCAALIETVQERRQNQNQQQQQQVVVSPNELFLATLAALTSLQGTLEQQVKRTDTDTESNNNNNNNSNEVETTALPLLEILRQILPYVAHPSNNHGALLLHQFGTVSRMLRMFVALGYAYTASSSTTGTNKATSTAVATSGANALLRQILKTTTMLLLITPSSTNTSTTQEAEKEMAKLLHATIIRMFHDVRPKVRKAAFGCAMDVVIVASSSNSSSSSSSPVVQQRKVIADFLWEYCHAVITQYKSSSSGSKKKNDSSNSKNLIHILRLLSTSLPYADDVRIRVRFGDDCLALMGGGGEGSGSNKGEVSMEVIRETLITLLSCLEKGEEDSDDGLLLSSMEQEVDTTKDTAKEDEEISKFAARALAFLLQHRPNAANSSFSSAGDVNVVYGRCLMGCVERMLVRANSGDEDGTLASKLLAMKLLPNVLTSILHLCDEAAEGEDGGAANSAEMCGSEFNQFVSRVMPIVTSYFNNVTSNNNLQRVAIEAVSNCIDIIRQALKIQYRNAWGNILPGGYATFTSTLALNLLEMRGAGNEANNGNSELEGKLQSWLKELVVSLLRLRDDVEKDGTARTA
eukprot:scaffold45243_cov168-Skeletonema_marinoi.AAC.1